MQHRNCGNPGGRFRIQDPVDLILAIAALKRGNDVRRRRAAIENVGALIGGERHGIADVRQAPERAVKVRVSGHDGLVLRPQPKAVARKVSPREELAGIGLAAGCDIGVAEQVGRRNPVALVDAGQPTPPGFDPP